MSNINIMTLQASAYESKLQLEGVSERPALRKDGDGEKTDSRMNCLGI